VPLWDAKARGLLIGLNLETKKQHIVRAILESIGFRYGIAIFGITLWYH
jgi:glycerol kinase